MAMVVAQQTVKFQSSPSPGTGTLTTDSFTPPANCWLYVDVYGQHGGGSTDPSVDFAVSDSVGLAWTAVEDEGEPNSWSTGMKVFKAWVGASPVAMTVTAGTGGARNMAFWHIEVVSATGQHASVPVGATVSLVTLTGGAKTLTLPGATALDEIVLVFWGVLNGGSSVTNGGTGYTTLVNSYNSDVPELMHAEYRENSTSTSVDSTIGTPEKAIAIAFVLKPAAAGAAAWIPPPLFF